MVEENVPGIQKEVEYEYEESKGSLSNRSNEAREEVTSEYSDISQEAKVYEEAIIYIAKTNIEKIGGSKLPNAFENNQKDNRVSTPDGHFYLKVGVSSAEQLILGSSFKEGVRHLEPNSRLLIEVKTKLPRDIGKLGKQIKKSYNQLEKLYKEYNLSSVEITNSSIGNYLIVFNGSDPSNLEEYFEDLKSNLPVNVQNIIGIIYCTKPLANSLQKRIKDEKSKMMKEVIKNQVIEEMKEEREQFDKQVIEEMKKREQFAKQVIEEMKKREQFAEQVIEEMKKREQFAKQVIEEMKKREQFAEQVIEETKKREQFGKQIEVNQMQLAKQIEEAKQLAKQIEEANQVAKQIEEAKQVAKQIEEANQVAKQIANQKQMWSKKVKYKKK